MRTARPAEVTSDRAVDPAPRRAAGIPAKVRKVVEPYHPRGAWRPEDRRRLQLVHQPDRQVRHRRPGRRRRPDRPQDHRRHLRRRGAAWRRRLLRQGHRPRSTARPPMPRATSPRTSSPRSSPTAARSSFPTPSASPSRCRSMSTCTAPARSTRRSSRERLAPGHGPVAARHPPASRPEQADLRADAPPTAISAARPAATAPSPGRRPTWPRRSRTAVAA